MIYFAYSVATRRIKIGHTVRGQKRLRELSREDRSISLLGVMHGNLSDELVVHQLFDRYHVKGEWYRDCPTLRKYIQWSTVATIEALNAQKIPDGRMRPGRLEAIERKRLAGISAGMKKAEKRGEQIGRPLGSRANILETDKGIAILRALRRGTSIRGIARELGVAANTVYKVKRQSEMETAYANHR